MANKTIDIDPNVTTVAELLNLATQTPSGIITLRGAAESEVPPLKWGIAIIVGPVADDAVNIIDIWADTTVTDLYSDDIDLHTENSPKVRESN